MTIDDYIDTYKSYAADYEKGRYEMGWSSQQRDYAIGRASEYKQLAEWLEELKELRAEVAELYDVLQAEQVFMREHNEQIRADAEAEHKAMCESCIHKVSADDIKAIRDSAIDDALHRILCLASHKAEFYSLENGEMIEAMQIEDIDKMIYEELAEQLKENSNGS